MSIGFGLVIGVPIALLALFVASKWHGSTDASRYADLLYDRRMARIGGAEIDREMTLRMAAVEFRRKVSIDVVATPANYEEIIIATARSEAMILAATDKQLAKQFLAWVEGADFDELLHPLAAKAVWRAVRRPLGHPVTLRLSGALRVQ